MLKRLIIEGATVMLPVLPWEKRRELGWKAYMIWTALTDTITESRLVLILCYVYKHACFSNKYFTYMDMLPNFFCICSGKISAFVTIVRVRKNHLTGSYSTNANINKAFSSYMLIINELISLSSCV